MDEESLDFGQTIVQFFSLGVFSIHREIYEMSFFKHVVYNTGDQINTMLEAGMLCVHVCVDVYGILAYWSDGVWS